MQTIIVAAALSLSTHHINHEPVRVYGADAGPPGMPTMPQHCPRGVDGWTELTDYCQYSTQRRSLTLLWI